MNVAFEDNLGVGRHWESRHLAEHHPFRPAAQAADHVEFERAVRGLQPTKKEGERVAADHHRHRHRFAALEVFFAMNGAVMTRRHENADGVPIKDLRAVGSCVQPVLFWITGDRIGSRANVAAAILLVPNRRGELRHVDSIAHDDILEDRSTFHDLVRHDLRVLQERFAVAVAQFPLGQMIGEA